MLTSREIVPLALVVAFFGAIGMMVMESRARRAERAPAVRLAGTPADARAGEPTATRRADAGPVPDVDPGDLGERPLRAAALPAPSREPDAIRRMLAALGGGTYIGDMLADDDSMLVRWPDHVVTTLRVWVQPESPLPAWNRAYPQMARDAFSEWNAAGFPMRFLHVVDSAAADLHVVFTTSLPAPRIGQTSVLRDKHGWLVAATITIATQDTAGTAIPAPLVAAIARHEVGHALGLGHSGNQETLMYPESRTTTITAIDRATLNLLYALPPGSVRAASP